MKDEFKSIDKLHDCLSNVHKSISKENPETPFDQIAEYVLFQALDHFGKGATKEAIVSILSYWRRSDFEDLVAFIERLDNMKDNSLSMNVK